MNLLFPTIKIGKPSKEIVQLYAHMMKPPNLKKALVFTLVICVLTVIFPLLAAGATPLMIVYVSPTLFSAAAFVCVAFMPRFAKLGGVLGLAILENLVLAIAPTLMLYPNQTDIQMLILYGLFFLCDLVWILVLYRLYYRKFEGIMQKRAHNMRYIRKTPWAGFLGLVTLVVITRLIINTFSKLVVGAACVIMIGYYINPLVAEQLVIMRQHSQMEPYLQEYAQEENEPEV